MNTITTSSATANGDKARTGVAGVALANPYWQSTLEDTLRDISHNESRAATSPNDTKLR